MSEQHYEPVDATYADEGSLLGDQPARRGGSRRGRKRRSGCLPVLLVLLLVGVGGYFLVRNIDIGNPFASEAEDFAGPGTGSVVFTVNAGDSISVQARNLEDLGVVASAQAYVEAAEADDAAGGIREGVYRVRKEMKASDVVTLLAGGTTKGSSFSFTSGKTVEEIVALLARDTDIGRKRFEAVLDAPADLGLPPAAEGDAEGYLSPGSYVFFPEDDATTILSAMVARTTQTLGEVDLAAASQRLGYDEHDLMTIASLVEAEGSLLDERGKSRIARVIYNRLENPTAETVGRLQLDATIDYIYGEKVARRTIPQIDAVADNPYNTYRQTGLPPGPIGTPSRAALEAAMRPADGPWFYYVTVNLDTGETKFAENYAQFLELDAELDAFCDGSDVC
jgi:UPF0755 protein